jgi:hypothetical protein
MPTDTIQTLFADIDPAAHADEAKARWATPPEYAESARRTRGYGPADWAAIKAEADALYRDLAALLHAGTAPGSPAAQAAIEAHRQHISRWFYPCTRAIHRQLGAMYIADPRFSKTIDRHAPPGLAQYLRDATAARPGRPLSRPRPPPASGPSNAPIRRYATAISTARRMFTLTSFDTPFTSIVTPYSRSAISIVRLLCVMMMNCVPLRHLRTIAPKRPTLASSSGASTSSSRQNGLGLIRKIAKIRLTAVSAFSPPDSSSRLRTCLPGGWATISTPVPSMILRSVSTQPRRPAAEQPREDLLEHVVDRLNVSTKRSRRRLVDLLDRLLQLRDRLSRSFFCVDRYSTRPD